MSTTNFVDGVTLTAAAWFNDADTAAYAALTSVAGTNIITANGPANFTYVSGRMVRFIPAATNTGATTINITPSGGSALGARNIFHKKLACVGGELKANIPTVIVDDGTRFHLVATGTDVLQRDLVGYISGLTYANNSGDATNDIDIVTGVALDSTNVYLMRLGSTLVKQLDAAWAVGTNAGGLDTGAIGNSDYYIHLIARSDTGVVDALFSLSATDPTMPTNYNYRRLIGWFKRVGATIVAFTTYETEGGGLELSWNAPTVDVNLAATLTTSRRTDAAKVPLNFSVTAILSIQLDDAASNFGVWITCPDHTDAAPSTVANANYNLIVAAFGMNFFFERRIRTSSAGLIAARATIATVDTYAFSTHGFTWSRR